jgi:hypothetical protein
VIKAETTATRLSGALGVVAAPISDATSTQTWATLSDSVPNSDSIRSVERCAPMPEHRGQNIAQRNTNNEKTNAKMQSHVCHYPALLGLFGNDDAQYKEDNMRLIVTK